jgi:ubiquinone/menaquinone biosynthesis C-methylase UbiE
MTKKSTTKAQKEYYTEIGRSHLTGYEGWPPPKKIKEHLSIFANFIKSNADGNTILDLGCGDGSIDRILAEIDTKIQITGLDLEAHEQWKIPHPKNLKFETGSIDALPYKAKSFDVVVMKDVLHHMPNPEKTLAEVAKLAKKQVIIIEANRYNPISFIRMVKIAKHEHFSRARLKKIVGKPGKFVTTETHVWPGSLETPGKLNDLVFNKVPLLSRLRNYNIVIFEP